MFIFLYNRICLYFYITEYVYIFILTVLDLQCFRPYASSYLYDFYKNIAFNNDILQVSGQNMGNFFYLIPCKFIRKIIRCKFIRKSHQIIIAKSYFSYYIYVVYACFKPNLLDLQVI